MLTDDLLRSLFDGQPHVLAPLLAGWLASSRRFAAFVSANQPKIRKKLRSTREPEALRDLQLELETAYLLLREPSLSVAYEPQPGKLGRHPDFAVRYTTSFGFMVEVTRFRAARGRASGEPGALPPHERPKPEQAMSLLDEQGDRFSDMLCSKLRQLAPRSCNLLIVGLQTEPPDASELRTAMLRIQQRAEANDPGIVHRPGFRDRPEFFQYYYRLSGVLIRKAPLQPGDLIVLWDNPQARYPLPSRARTALSRSHAL